MNSVRAVVKIEIDGKDVLNGDELVVNANSHIDLERFLGESQYEGRKFKFIERTAEIEAHKGIGGEDGLIRVSYRFEKFVPKPAIMARSILRGSSGSGGRLGGDFYGGSFGMNSVSPMGMSSFDSTVVGARSMPETICSAQASLKSPGVDMVQMDCSFADAMPNDAGITVEGSKSNQSFYTVTVGELEQQEHVMVLKMSGYIGQSETVTQPITVKTRKYCSSCGATYKSNMEYCSKDGTYLRLEQPQVA